MKTLVIGLLVAGNLTSLVAMAQSNKEDQRALVAYMQIVPGKQRDFLREAKEVITQSRKEAGNISYQLHQSETNPELFMFYELFETKEDLTFHRNAIHTKSFLSKTKPYTVKFSLEEYAPKEGTNQ